MQCQRDRVCVCVCVCVCVLTLSIKDTVKHCSLLLLPSTGHDVHKIFKRSTNWFFFGLKHRKFVSAVTPEEKGHRDAEMKQQFNTRLCKYSAVSPAFRSLMRWNWTNRSTWNSNDALRVHKNGLDEPGSSLRDLDATVKVLVAHWKWVWPKNENTINL